LILVVAAFFRFYRLDAIPPGLTHDEADTGYFVASVYRGTPSTVDVPYGYAYKPFTKYSGALFMLLFGPTDLALRLHSAFFGTLLVLVTYLWVQEAFGMTAGLGGAGLMAVPIGRSGILPMACAGRAGKAETLVGLGIVRVAAGWVSLRL
jgi:4-amino-4-deoxy-L-arabinose transferase-like glycosyltransferase